MESVIHNWGSPAGDGREDSGKSTLDLNTGLRAKDRFVRRRNVAVLWRFNILLAMPRSPAAAGTPPRSAIRSGLEIAKHALDRKKLAVVCVRPKNHSPLAGQTLTTGQGECRMIG